MGCVYVSKGIDMCLSSFLSSCPIHLLGIHYVLDPGVIKKRVRLSTVLWELTDVGKLDTQRHDKKSMHIVEQMSNLSEFAKASQKN